MSDEKAKNKIKIDITKIKIFFKKFLSFIFSAWFFTIFFFLVVFGFSLWIWWNYVLNANLETSQISVEMQKDQQLFDLKRKKIDSLMEKLQQRELDLQNASNYELNRKIFKSSQEIFEELEKSQVPKEEEEKAKSIP